MLEYKPTEVWEESIRIHTRIYLPFIFLKKENRGFTNILCVDWHQHSYPACMSDGLLANTVPRPLEGKGSSHSKERVTEGSVG